MSQFDLYGARGMDIDQLQQAAASALGVEFKRRYSDYTGHYYSADAGDENFAVYLNFQDAGDEDQLLEPEFADRPVLFYVNGTARADEIQALLVAIPGLEHLRRDTLE